MSLRPGTRDFVWMACGAAALAAVVAIALHFGDKPSAADALAAHGRKLALVDQMRVALASAAAGELGAVLGPSDEHSQRFADEARAALADLEVRRGELESLIRTSGHGDEAELLEAFGTSFSTLRQVDDELLQLATRNTNLKASALARGPLAEASRELQRALSALPVPDSSDPARPLVLALEAQVGPSASREACRLTSPRPPTRRWTAWRESSRRTPRRCGGPRRPALPARPGRERRADGGRGRRGPLPRARGRDPEALPREHQRPVAGDRARPAAGGAGREPAGPRCAAAGDRRGARRAGERGPPALARRPKKISAPPRSRLAR